MAKNMFVAVQASIIIIIIIIIVSVLYTGKQTILPP
jgi:hypothetical protein